MEGMSDDQRLRVSSVSVDNDQGDMVLSLHEWIDGGMRTTRVLIPADEVGGFATQVTNHAVYALSFVAEAWRRGECSTCHNIRLVEVVKPNGYETNAYCTDCAKPAGTFEGYPRVGPPAAATS